MINSNFPFDLSLKMDSNPSLPGLDSFLKSLERMFFGEVEAQLLASRNGDNKLVLNVRCNMDLLEILYHHQQHTWGHTMEAGFGKSPTKELAGLLQELQRQNRTPVDIEELNLELKDILLVVRRIGPNSIVNELERLLGEIAAHYVHFTNGLEAAPYEIYIPVSEADLEGSETSVDPSAEYYRYWAIYFESDTDAHIYSLQGNNFLNETLHYGNPE